MGCNTCCGGQLFLLLDENLEFVELERPVSQEILIETLFKSTLFHNKRGVL